MADFREKPNDPGAPQPGNPQQAAIERLLMSYGDQTFQEFSRYRFAEEREWYEQALFYQRRQWLRWNDTTRRFDQVKQDTDRPKPMPVSNYFKFAINTNANQLQKPRMTATATDDADANRRGAEYAQRAIEAIDRESGFNIVQPKLAKHVPLWGIGITKDCIDTSAAAGVDQVGQYGIQTSKMVSCLDCGKVSPVQTSAQPAQQTPGIDTDPNQPVKTVPESGQLEEAQEGASVCPKCGSSNVVPFDKNSLGAEAVREFPKGKLCTEVVPIFEVYLPRDCRDANLSPRICQRYRKPLGKLRQMYGDRAANIKAEAPYDVHQIYMEALRALVNYNYMHEQTIETTTITEIWADWAELPKKIQDKLEMFWQGNGEADKIEKAHLCGIYEIYAGGTMLDWGVNYLWDETEQCAYKPYTFYLWELDPANIYNTGVGTDMVPLQKRLNRLDSLNELAWMCNGAGKWLWPTTQTGKTPTGSPNEVISYEAIGEGKVAPTFVAGDPINQGIFMLRQSILTDIQTLTNTLGIAQGQANGQKAFRAVAYLGQKAEEQTNTQRYLWEKGNELRYKKVLLMAQKCWDRPRKARVAGYNGKFGMMALDGNMLQGNYTLQFVADSSRPQLPSEKQAAFGMMAQGGLVDPTDPSVREYVADTLNMNSVNMVDHLQYLKAERDLERLKQGQLPKEVPFQKWDVFLKVFANFTLTEEFEALDPTIQQGILMYTEHLSQMQSMAMAPPPNVQAMAAQLGGAMAGAKGGKKKPGQGSPLNGVPGQSVSTAGAQQAAVGQAENVRAQV